MLRNFLQGKFFQYPLHTMLVHFPIGLFSLSFLLDLIAWLLPPANASALRSGAFYTLAAGIGMALLAAIPGLADWTTIRADHPGKKTATIHLLLNLAAVGFYLLNFFLRLGSLQVPTPSIFPFLLSVIGLGLLSLSGYLGGQLVYEHGLGVGRHQRWTDTPRQTLYASAAVTTPSGWIPVAQTSSLSEGETLRIQIDGTVMTLCKLEGAFYAFQEFCTHRGGPLSEGSFQSGQVQCPWHGSCFDIRTGQVVRGPAKAALRTYPVMVWADTLHVRLSPEVIPDVPKDKGQRPEKRREPVFS
jgi:nitrite reductase/ring-hydroxylating ferredoxin subunit/uncharacterized membrane protein